MGEYARVGTVNFQILTAMSVRLTPHERRSFGASLLGSCPSLDIFLRRKQTDNDNETDNLVNTQTPFCKVLVFTNVTHSYEEIVNKTHIY